MKVTRRYVVPTVAPLPDGVPLTAVRIECAAAATAIRFDATALPLHSLTYTPGHDGMRLDATVLVPNRDGSDEAVLITRAAIQPWSVLEFNGPEYLVRWTAETLCGLMAHEVYESLRYCGRLVIDHHASLSRGEVVDRHGNPAPGTDCRLVDGEWVGVPLGEPLGAEGPTGRPD